MPFCGAGLVEHGRPAVGRRRHGILVVHQQVGAAAVRDAVHLAVDRVPRLVLQRLEDVRVVGDQPGVDRLDVAAGDEAQGGVAGGGHDVVLAGAHQLHGLVGGAEGLDGDLAAALLLEVGDPVDRRVVGAVLDVAGPGEDADLALGGAERREGLEVGDLEAAGGGGAAAGAGAAVRVGAAGRQGQGGHGDDGAEPEGVGGAHGDLLGGCAGLGVTRVQLCDRDLDDVACGPAQVDRCPADRALGRGCGEPFCSRTTSRPPASRSTT